MSSFISFFRIIEGILLAVSLACSIIEELFDNIANVFAMPLRIDGEYFILIPITSASIILSIVRPTNGSCSKRIFSKSGADSLIKSSVMYLDVSFNICLRFFNLYLPFEKCSKFG